MDAAVPTLADLDPPLAVAPGEDVWVFAYGSLIWRPGFAYVERRPALLRGYHRSFCIYSHRYRGTPEVPGLVLGLDRGGACRGVAFRIAAAEAPATLAYLWRRELVTGVYRPTLLTVDLGAGRTVRACAFVADRRHPQYCGRLDPAQAAAMILQGHGESGPNWEYLANTVQHLDELGLADRGLKRLLDIVDQARAAATPGS